jgi:hypothetical protein
MYCTRKQSCDTGNPYLHRVQQATGTDGHNARTCIEICFSKNEQAVEQNTKQKFEKEERGNLLNFLTRKRKSAHIARNPCMLA